VSDDNQLSELLAEAVVKAEALRAAPGALDPF